MKINTDNTSGTFFFGNYIIIYKYIIYCSLNIQVYIYNICIKMRRS